MVAAAFYLIALVVMFLIYARNAAPQRRRATTPPRRAAKRAASVPSTFRNVLAFENFLLMAVVIFGLQFVDRSFGPVLPLYVGELGAAPARIPLVSGILFSIAAGAGAIGHHFCARLLQRRTATAADRGRVGGGRGRGARRIWPRATSRWLFLATPLFGLAIGVGTTAAYTAAAAVIPANVRGTGFGLLDDGVADRPRRQPGRSAACSPPRPSAPCSRWTSSRWSRWRSRSIGWAATGDRAPSTPSDEPVPENL